MVSAKEFGTMTPHDSNTMLSKSRFTAGLQCLRRLYLAQYERELATPADAAKQSRLGGGTEVGVVARALRPGGVLIDEAAYEHDKAVERTRALLARDDVPAIYEAAFIEEGVRIRTDILARSSAGMWDLIEVKASTSVKPEHIPDAAVQLVVLERTGLVIDKVCLAHINREYVYPGGDYEAVELLAVEDITVKARDYAPRVQGELRVMRAMLAEDQAPDIAVGPHCHAPYDCEFYAHCRGKEPDWSIEEFPRLRALMREELRASGVRSIVDIPDGFTLTLTQARIRQAVLSGEPYIGPLLHDELQRIVAPAHFIDFETVAPGLPVYPGTRPYQAQPFQWSDHVLHPDGKVTHQEFLGEGIVDPRAEFVETLIAQLEGAATVVVYSPYERTCLRALQSAFPEYRLALEQVLAGPWVDLLQMVRDHYYHAEFHGSFSIKSVLPALAPGFGYGGLAIQGGVVASNAYLESIDPGTDPERREQLRADLLAYCKQDTEAMLRVVAAMRGSSRRALEL
jgi:hypothetical protein